MILGLQELVIRARAAQYDAVMAEAKSLTVVAILAAASPALTGAVPPPDMTFPSRKPIAVADKGKLLSLDEHLHNTHERASPPPPDMPPGQASTDLPPMAYPPWRSDTFYQGSPPVLLSSVASSE